MTAENRLSRILLTGAAGGLGRVLRERLPAFADIVRLSDISAMEPARSAAEEIAPCDLADKAAVDALVAGCDAIIHLGGVSVERPFEEILEANIKGVFHIYEAARRHGVRRVVFASSNHVIGFYRQDERIDALSPRRPDGYYGLSKSFGEDMASFYFDRYGIETVSLRIGSSFPAPKDRRMLRTWLSYDDLTQLVQKALFTPDVGHTWSSAFPTTPAPGGTTMRPGTLAMRLGTAPKPFRAQVEAQPAPAADDPVAVYQGGAFTAQGPFEP